MAATWEPEAMLSAVRAAARSAAQGDYSSGRRPPHAFGVRAVGTFTPNRTARRFGATVFQSSHTDVEVRFSVTGGGVEGRDNGENNLGLAVRFASGGDLVAVNIALFPVHDPGDFPTFLDQVKSSDRWGTTEQYLQHHPESIMPVIAYGRSRRRGRAASFGETTYHGNHAFWLAPSASSTASTRETLVRYHWQPAAGDNAGLSWDDPQRELGVELTKRLAAECVRFTLVLDVAGLAQRADDPSEFWPETLERLIVGELVLTAILDEGGANDGEHSFPAFRPDRPPIGWRADDGDEVMKARAVVYAGAARDREASAQGPTSVSVPS